MQFNPLFLNDIKGNQTLTSSKGKLQKNKYLFSEIITVVMKDSDKKSELKKLSLDEQTEAAEIVGGSNPQVIEQLQNKTISDAENEKMKVQLSDILPEDMAKLLTNDDTDLNDKNIVSYIGKEQMQGDLQNFLTNLVGEKVFEKHVTDNSGVLIKMEDAKSSVNIEIIKELNNSASENKTMVRALIIPEKGKIQLFPQGKSLLSELENSNTLKKIIDTGKVENLEKELNKEIFQKTVAGKSKSAGETTKPTLSVFSFKVDSTENAENNFTGKLKELVTKNENELENIVKSTKFLNKVSETNKKQNEIVTEKLNVSSDKKILLSETKENNSNKDINISKITIIKKQDLTPTQEIINNQSDLQKLSKTSGETNISEKITAEMEPVKNSQAKKIEGQLKSVEANNKLPVENNNEDVESKVKISTQELQKDIKGTEKIQKNDSDQKTSSVSVKENVQLKNEIDTKGTQQVNKTFKAELENVINKKNDESDTVVKNESDKKTSSVSIKENVQLKNEIETKGTQQVSKTFKAELENVINKKNDESNTVVKNDSDKQIQEKPNEKAVNKNVVKSLEDKKNILIKDNKPVDKREDNDITKIKNEKTTEVNKIKNNFNAKATHNHQAINKSISNEEKNQIENQTLQNVSKVVVEKAEKNLIPNKKVSVKVKKIVKSVNSKTEQEHNITSELRLEQKENQSGENTEYNNSKNAPSFKSTEFDIHSKKKTDLAFHHVMQKEQGFKLNQSGITPQEVQQQNSERIVKSIEVIKEISKFISAQKKGSFSFTIKPEHLGHLKITLETNNHLMNAHIQVENEQAKFLVEKNLNELHTQLQESGVELNSLNISLGYSSNPKEFSERQSSPKQVFNNTVIEETSKDKKETKSLGYNTYEYLA